MDKPSVTIKSKFLTDILELPTSEDLKSHLPICLEYLVGQQLKKLPNAGVYTKTENGEMKELTLEEYSQGQVEVIEIKDKRDVDKEIDPPLKSCKHSVEKTKLASSFMNSGKKTHSSECSFDVISSILALAKRNTDEEDLALVSGGAPGLGTRPKEQTAKDDNSFWKNPVNQQQQHLFNKMSPLSPKFDGAITEEELAKHNKPEDCWTCVEGKVYDVTKYSGVHPGGKKINLGWGKDSTKLFQKYHSWVNIDSIIGKCFIGYLQK